MNPWRLLVLAAVIVVFTTGCQLVTSLAGTGTKTQAQRDSDARSSLQGSWLVTQHPAGWVADR